MNKTTETQKQKIEIMKSQPVPVLYHTINPSIPARTPEKKIMILQKVCILSRDYLVNYPSVGNEYALAKYENYNVFHAAENKNLI